MDDLIFRQVAIDALEARKDKSAEGAIGCFYNTIIQNDIKALKGLPSAESERKKGYMKIKVISALDGEGLFCENCNAYCLSPLYNFCPKCGVEFIGVRGEQE